MQKHVHKKNIRTLGKVNFDSVTFFEGSLKSGAALYGGLI